MSKVLLEQQIPVSSDGACPEAPEPVPEPAALVGAELDRITMNGWTVDRDTFWTHVRPAVRSGRIQGWKLHVSATIVSAPEVLRRCLPVIVESETSFKFASTKKNIRELNDFRTPRGNSGKFITVYPADDAVFRELARRLDEATDGMAGPLILSDAPYRDGSLVHYRYGAFDGLRVLSNDGTYRNCLLGPDGYPVEDQRPAVFSPPAWAVLPIKAQAGATTTGAAAVLLHGRYEVSAAIRHANKGGVYRAADRLTGTEVLVKEARPHVATDEMGRDVRALLRHEAKVLAHLASLGVVPQIIDEFDQEGHHFLVEEFIAGETLLQKVGLAAGEGTLWPAADEVPGLVHRLARILRAVHAADVVIRDLSPNNILILEDGELRLIDLELAAIRSDPAADWDVLCVSGGTRGYSAPEQFAGAPPAFSADRFSLGALACFLTTQLDPVRVDDRPDGCPLEDRVAELLTPPLLPQPPAEVTPPIIAGLMRSDAESRMSLDEVIRLTSTAGTPAASAAARPAPEEPDRTEAFGEDRWHTLVTGMLRHLATNLPADPEARPWPETGFGTEAEMCAVQHGLAGGLAVLARLAEHGYDQHVPELLDAVLPRITRHLSRGGHRLPGLYFGSAGTAWALFDAGRALDRPELSARAVELAASLPTSWPNSDITHGLAGLGTCLLYLWQRTGDARLLDRATACAERVLAAARTRGDAICWTTPESFDSELAGYRSYGFAHGIAGIGAFLLAAGQATDQADLVAAARRCGETLLDAAIHVGDVAYWPDVFDSAKRMVFWCNGSSGVGTFLCRLYAHDGDRRYQDAATAAGRAVLRNRWHSGTTYCHGLAGNADFLLDLAASTGTGRTWAGTLAELLWARRIDRAGSAVLPDETGMEVTGGYGTGLFGHLSFLLRLRHGGSRLFHLDGVGPQ